MITLDQVSTQTPQVVTLSEAAAKMVRDILAKEQSDTLALRVYVAGGGCSGPEQNKNRPSIVARTVGCTGGSVPARCQEAAGTTFAFFNNHARGSAARNAELFIALLRNKYGDAAEIVARREGVPAQGKLF